MPVSCSNSLIHKAPLFLKYKFQITLPSSKPSGLGRWRCNPDVPGSRPPPYHQRDLFLGRPEFKSSVTLCK